VVEAKGPSIVHILIEKTGRPYCGFSKDNPKDWPAEHTWLGINGISEPTCPECIKKQTDEFEKLASQPFAHWSKVLK
jgi:hypothetical protein